jgi:hypothetical protein
MDVRETPGNRIAQNRKNPSVCVAEEFFLPSEEKLFKDRTKCQGATFSLP